MSRICQSCGMNMDRIEDFGTNADKTPNDDYCVYCFKDGSFTNNYTIEEDVYKRQVLPEELKDLQIVEGQDYCTLVTCTPYGVNSHRLLVRGHRVPNDENADNIRVTADAMQIDPTIVAPVAAVPLLLILLAAVLIKTRKKKGRIKEGGSDENTTKEY